VRGLDLFYSCTPDIPVQMVERNPTNQTAIGAINGFAAMLAARFNPVVGCTRSWDSSVPTDFQVSTPQFRSSVNDAL
jgi:hypothetical protein